MDQCHSTIFRDDDDDYDDVDERDGVFSLNQLPLSFFGDDDDEVDAHGDDIDDDRVHHYPYHSILTQLECTK